MLKKTSLSTRVGQASEGEAEVRLCPPLLLLLNFNFLLNVLTLGGLGAEPQSCDIILGFMRPTSIPPVEFCIQDSGEDVLHSATGKLFSRC